MGCGRLVLLCGLLAVLLTCSSMYIKYVCICKYFTMHVDIITCDPMYIIICMGFCVFSTLGIAVAQILKRYYLYKNKLNLPTAAVAYKIKKFVVNELILSTPFSICQVWPARQQDYPVLQT